MTRPADFERKAETVRVLMEVANATHAIMAEVLSMGLVARQPHPVDGRKRTLALTEHGHEPWEALRTRLHASGLFAGLDAQEQDTLLALLTKLRTPQRP
jgi:DNA-binding MarR family transcriptional regulator